MDAAIDGAVFFDTVTDHAAATVIANRREGVNRTLERIERVLLVILNDGKAFIVIVSANFALHGLVLRGHVNANGMPREE